MDFIQTKNMKTMCYNDTLILEISQGKIDNLRTKLSVYNNSNITLQQSLVRNYLIIIIIINNDSLMKF